MTCWRKRYIALVMFTDSLTDTSPDGVVALHQPLTDRGEKNQSAQMKVAQGDYLASNRVLAPTLRLKPFSITGISADVAPASPDPLELPASCPLCVCRFTASLLGHSVRPPDQQRVTGDLGMAPIQTRTLPKPMQGDPD